MPLSLCVSCGPHPTRHLHPCNSHHTPYTPATRHQVPSKALEAASRRTKQIVAEHATIYTHASTIANELRMSPRVLGRITGSLWLGEGGDRCDIGLCVKNAKEGLCVPGEAPRG